MEKNVVQKVLRNEITWVVFIVVSLWGFVTTVVLPLQKLQIQVAQVQIDLSSQNKKYDALTTSVNTLTTRTSVIESRLDSNKK